ncbi:MAG: hypothetical protein ACXVZ4_03720 [Gaiellaceae bacterium]
MTRFVAVGLAAAAAAGLIGAGRADARASVCPQGLLPRAAPPTAAERRDATGAALRYVRTRYAPPRTLVTERMFVAAVSWVPYWHAGGFVASSCGGSVSARTIAVSVVFPVMYDEPTRLTAGCGFCAAATFLVSRTTAGWRVWYTL